MKPILPVLEYVIHYDYIVKELCENKAKPEMKCNGKCHLMKELAKASENEKPISSDKKVSLQEKEMLFFQEIKLFEITANYFHTTKSINTDYSNLYFHLNIISVFHPPTIIS